MLDQLGIRAWGLGLLACLAGGGFTGLHAQDVDPRERAVGAVAEVLILRRGALGDTLTYDACSIYEQTGWPSNLPLALPPGLVPLLDRPGPDPCAVVRSVADDRFPHQVRVRSVTIADSTAIVHLSITRGEWSYDETYCFSALPNGRWGFREARMTHPFRRTAGPGPTSPE